MSKFLDLLEELKVTKLLWGLFSLRVQPSIVKIESWQTNKLYRESSKLGILLLHFLRAVFCNCSDNTSDDICESEPTTPSLLVSAL